MNKIRKGDWLVDQNQLLENIVMEVGDGSNTLFLKDP